MRMDKRTSRYQQALAEAQSLAVGRDHPAIEPPHLLQALLDQDGGSTQPLLQNAGINIDLLRSKLARIIDELPKLANATGEVNVSPDLRSEEHTSELQSLMRISYAAFCLKKKNKTTTITNNT